VAIDSKFAQALISRKYKVLDRTLKPFSLWHYSALAAIENSWTFGDFNPFQTQEEALAELYQAVNICANGFDPELTALDYDLENKERQTRLGFHFVNFVEEAKLFKTYIKDHSAAPEFWEKKGSTGQDTGMPAVGQLLGILFQCGFSEKEAWEMPMGRAQFYAAFIACTRPNGGPGPRWVTDKQRDSMGELLKDRTNK
tara:strand:- start:4512 stop:5105 length:594 start_codon:yes stop_codon:yes gene_type:complete